MKKCQSRDIATKNYVELNEVFSDLFGLAYPRHKVEGLSFLPSRMLGSRERDVVKGGKVSFEDEAFVAMLLIECQSYVDRTMPVRMMSYEAESILWAASQKRRANKTSKNLASGGEFISGLKEGEKVPPVLSLVVHWGAKAWDGSTRLSDVVEHSESMGSSCEIRLVDLMRLTDEQIATLKSDLKEVVLFMQNRKDEPKLDKLIDENYERFSSMSVEGAAVLKSLANIDIKIDKRKETYDMCKAWNDRKKSGIREGRKEGYSKGFGMGERKNTIKVVMNMHNMSMAIPDIASVVEKSETEVRRIISTNSRQSVNA